MYYYIAFVALLSVLLLLFAWKKTNPRRLTKPVPHVSVFMISLPHDQWKRDRFEKSAHEHGQTLAYSIWEGIMHDERPEVLKHAINKKYVDKPRFPRNRGNIGSALAHITLWEHIASRDSKETFLILEDNALTTGETDVAVSKFQDMDFDLLNLCVIRPRGDPTPRSGVLRISHVSNLGRYPPNIWMSSYMIRPDGARKLLKLFREYAFDISAEAIDRCVVKVLHSKGGSSSIKAFVVDHHRYFGHVETSGDTRKRLNNEPLLPSYPQSHNRTKSTLVLYSHYDTDQNIAPYVTQALKHLKDVTGRCDIVFLSNVKDSQLARIDDCIKYVRMDTGLCVTNFRMFLQQNDISAYNKVIFLNDTIKFNDLRAVFEWADSTKYDFWGLSESLQISRHVQSFFVVLNGKAAISAWVKYFTAPNAPVPPPGNYRISMSTTQRLNFKRKCIRYYEVGLTSHLKSLGLSGGGYISSPLHINPAFVENDIFVKRHPEKGWEYKYQRAKIHKGYHKRI